MANSPFSPSQRERDRFMETMNSPVPPSIVDPYRWPGTPVMPQPQHVRRMTSPAAGGLLGEGSGLDEYSPAYAAAKEWDGGHPYKEMEAALAGRLQQSRRSQAPGPNREPADLGSYLARQHQQQQQHHHHQHQQQQQHPQQHQQHQNTRSEFRCPAEAGMGRHPGRVTAMRERLRRLDHRRMPLEDRQEQVMTHRTPGCDGRKCGGGGGGGRIFEQRLNDTRLVSRRASIVFHAAENILVHS